MNSRLRLIPTAWCARALVIGALALCIGGCASTPSTDPDIDPYEGFNRSIYAFNKSVDDVALRPAAQAYQAVTPEFVNSGVTNFFANLADIGTAINNLLQLKPLAAIEDVGRIAFNTTIGIGGFIDIASGLGMERHEEDFGQTLGYWGASPGPYLVLPLFGPSDVRDAAGRLVDTTVTSPLFYLDETAVTLGMGVLNVLDQRADLLGAQRVIDVASLDEYYFVRDAYLQRRLNLVYDGDPPESDEDL